ncbi:hypothetical protein [Pedobacter sp. UYP1]|uniref:hypothetical protein n=1 Tax=Pedobacter sp. UYP1 TaxID=1756396 RepID=UPI003392A31C
MEKQLVMVIFNGKFLKGILGGFIFKVVDSAKIVSKKMYPAQWSSQDLPAKEQFLLLVKENNHLKCTQVNRHCVGNIIFPSSRNWISQFAFAKYLR